MRCGISGFYLLHELAIPLRVKMLVIRRIIANLSFVFDILGFITESKDVSRASESGQECHSSVEKQQGYSTIGETYRSRHPYSLRASFRIKFSSQSPLSPYSYQRFSTQPIFITLNIR